MENSIVLSTRIRLARNFKNYPFISKLSREDAEKIANLEKKLNSGLDAYREIKGQAVTLIDNICKYLYQPKAISYLIEKLKISFYKVY